MEEFLATVTTQEWNRAQDAGRPWAEAVEELAERHPEQRDLIEAYWRRWPETLGDAIEPTVALLDELRSTGIRLYALSNWSGETFPLARPRYPFLEWFDGIVISGDERLAKPDPRIFDRPPRALWPRRRARRCSSTTTPRTSRPRPRWASRPSGSSAATDLRADLERLGLLAARSCGRVRQAGLTASPRSPTAIASSMTSSIARGSFATAKPWTIARCRPRSA